MVYRLRNSGNVFQKTGGFTEVCELKDQYCFKTDRAIDKEVLTDFLCSKTGKVLMEEISTKKEQKTNTLYSHNPVARGKYYLQTLHFPPHDTS